MHDASIGIENTVSARAGDDHERMNRYQGTGEYLNPARGTEYPGPDGYAKTRTLIRVSNTSRSVPM